MYFITGNKNKFQELAAILTGIEQLDIDLPEIQELDSQKIIEAKVASAFTHHNGPFLVEDQSLCFTALGSFPGPLIKWLLQSASLEDIAKIPHALNNTKATASTLLGYAESPHSIHFFDGSVSGSIVSPRGENGFGWDKLFQPDGHTKTFGEMSLEEKNPLSMRGIAALKLKEFLATQR